MAAALTAVSACAGPGSTTSISATPARSATTGWATSGSGESYVGQVSALCATLQVQEQAIVDSFPSHFPVAKFLADTERFQPLLVAFDAKLAALPIRTTDQAGVAAFAAYVKESTASRQLRVAAAHRGQTYYDAEYDRQLKLDANDPVLEAIDSLGFSGACHYR